MSMCGVLGWVSRGHCEEKIDTAAFDIVWCGKVLVRGKRRKRGKGGGEWRERAGE